MFGRSMNEENGPISEDEARQFIFSAYEDRMAAADELLREAEKNIMEWVVGNAVDEARQWHEKVRKYMPMMVKIERL